MTVLPLLTASPLALRAAHGLARQLPGQAASFLRALGSAVGAAPTSGAAAAADAAPRASLATVGGDLMESLRNTAVDQPTRVLRRLQQAVTEAIQKATRGGDAAPNVRVRISGDRGIHVVGDSPDKAAIEHALAADPEITELVNRLPPAWLQAGLDMTVRGLTENHVH